MRSAVAFCLVVLATSVAMGQQGNFCNYNDVVLQPGEVLVSVGPLRPVAPKSVKEFEEITVGPGCGPNDVDIAAGQIGGDIAAGQDASTLMRGLGGLQLPANASDYHSVLVVPVGDQGDVYRQWFSTDESLRHIAERTTFHVLDGTDEVAEKWPMVKSAPAFFVLAPPVNGSSRTVFFAGDDDFPNSAHLLAGLMASQISNEAGQWYPCPPGYRYQQIRYQQQAPRVIRNSNVVWTTPTPSPPQQGNILTSPNLRNVPNALPIKTPQERRQPIINQQRQVPVLQPVQPQQQQSWFGNTPWWYWLIFVGGCLGAAFIAHKNRKNKELIRSLQDDGEERIEITRSSAACLPLAFLLGQAPVPGVPDVGGLSGIHLLLLVAGVGFIALISHVLTKKDVKRETKSNLFEGLERLFAAEKMPEFEEMADAVADGNVSRVNTAKAKIAKMMETVAGRNELFKGVFTKHVKDIAAEGNVDQARWLLKLVAGGIRENPHLQALMPDILPLAKEVVLWTMKDLEGTCRPFHTWYTEEHNRQCPAHNFRKNVVVDFKPEKQTVASVNEVEITAEGTKKQVTVAHDSEFHTEQSGKRRLEPQEAEEFRTRRERVRTQVVQEDHDTTQFAHLPPHVVQQKLAEASVEHHAQVAGANRPPSVAPGNVVSRSPR